MVDLDINVTVDRNVTPIPTGNFNLPLILAASGNTPQDQYDLFSTLADLQGTYTEADHPHISSHAEQLFEEGADQVAVYNVDRAGAPSVGDLSTALDGIADQSFFYIVSTLRNGTNPDSEDTDGDRTDVSDWAQANDRVYFATNEIAESISDQTTFLAGISNDQTYYLAYENTNQGLDNLDEPVNAAMCGRASANFPGSINFKWQQFSLIDANASDYTQTEVDNLETDGGHAYVQSKGVPVTSGGESTDPQIFIDIPIIQLWLKDNLEARFVNLLEQQPKVPFTEEGIVTVEELIRDAFQEGDQEDVIVADESTVDMPDIDNQSRSDRILDNVRFEARLSGAISDVTIDGQLVT